VVIVTVVLTGLLLVCGGCGVGLAAWLRVNRGVTDGQPTAAANVFLDAVFGPSASQGTVESLICADSGTQIANRSGLTQSSRAPT
jgi:hypothetical protein